MDSHATVLEARARQQHSHGLRVAARAAALGASLAAAARGGVERDDPSLLTVQELRAELKAARAEIEAHRRSQNSKASSSSTGELFVDAEFPAEARSLLGDAGAQSLEAIRDDAAEGLAAEKEKGEPPPRSSSKPKLKGWLTKRGALQALQTPLNWKRPTDMGYNALLFESGVRPNDVLQGALGNCWLLSAMASLAERSWRVRRLFRETSTNPSGRYHVTLYKDGLRRTYTIDDLLPVTVDGTAPYCARGRNGKLWPSLLEKAMAKAHGSYAALKAGYSHEAFLDLTGAP